MKQLRIPAALIITTIASGGAVSCSPSPAPTDGSTQDIAMQDSAPSDGSCSMQDATSTPPFDRVLCGRVVDGGLESCGAPCTNGACSADCRLCVANEFEGAIGIACRPRAGSSASCPMRVCQASDCPSAGCESCISPLFCIPDQTMVDGSMHSCVGTTCDPANGCPAGCRAVG